MGFCLYWKEAEMRIVTIVLFYLMLSTIVLGQSLLKPKGIYLTLRGDFWPKYEGIYFKYFTPAIPIEFELGLSQKANIGAYGLVRVAPTGTTQLNFETGIHKYFRLPFLKEGASYCGPFIGAGGVYNSTRMGYLPTSSGGPLSREYDYGVGGRVGFQVIFKNRVSVSVMLEAMKVYQKKYFPLFAMNGNREWANSAIPRFTLGYLVSKKQYR
jgi:hypothetical protein